MTNTNRKDNAIAFLDRARSNAKLSSTDSLGFYIMTSVGIGIVNLLGILMLWVSYNGLANRPTPALVQLADGKTIKVATLDDNQRTPQVIKDFASLTMTKMFTWRGILPPEKPEDLSNPKPDLGIEIPDKQGGKTLKVPTLAWRTSFALSSDFQNSFLRVLGGMAEQVRALDTKSETGLEILNIGDPVSTGTGTWRVPIVANLVMIKRGINNLPTRIGFNKDIYIRTVPVPHLVDDGNSSKKQVAELIAESRAAGMEIFAIRDYERQDLKPNHLNPVPIAPVQSSPSTPTQQQP
jgi:hypothetical protein